MAATLLLDRIAWDLALDVAGNIALATEPYAQVQDAASACRLCQGEQYYQTPIGVPYYQEILGKSQPIQIIEESMAVEAEAVPGVLRAAVILVGHADRSLSGQVQIKTQDGDFTGTI